jgi:hypothetical protein
MQAVFLLFIIATAFAAPKCAQTSVSNVVKDLEQKQPLGTKTLALENYKKSLLGDDIKIPKQNRTEAIKQRLAQINNGTVVNKTREVLEQMEKISINIKAIEKETTNVNNTIIETLKRINATQASEKLQLKEKLEQVAKEKSLIDALNKKKEELRQKKIELLRLKATAQKIVDHETEQMRERRRFVKDLEEKKKRMEETKVAVDGAKEKELAKRVEAIKKANSYSENLREQDLAQEMREREQKLRQDRLAEQIRRKMLILQEQIKTAKIKNNEEARVRLEKKLIELKRYKKAKIACAQNALRKYKLENQKKIEDLKQKVLDTQLNNRLIIQRNDYMAKIKAELADEIDDLKKQKTAFETAKTIAQKKIANDMKIEKDNLKAAKHAQVRKNMAYKNNRKDMKEMRGVVMRAEKAHLEREATAAILKNVISATAKRNAMDKNANLDIAMKKAEVENKKQLLNTIATGVKSTVEAEKANVENLKNAAVKSKQERHVFKTQIARDILIEAHKRQLAHLKERKAEIEAIVKAKIADRNRKAALKLNKAQSKIALAGLQGKLDKKYILKRQEIALKNAKALSDSIKGLMPNKGEKFLKLKQFKVNCGSLAKKMSTPCGKK